jgi:hypothetical protein
MFKFPRIIAGCSLALAVGCGVSDGQSIGEDQIGAALSEKTATSEPANSDVAPAYSCTFDSVTHVQGADWLRIHVTPSVSSSAVGQIPDKAQFNFCSSSFMNIGTACWVYGYGFNGSKKLTGWADCQYLIFP